MKPATFHNAVLTLVSGYAEALAETEAAREMAVQTLELARKARPTTPRLEKAARAVLAAWDEKCAGRADGIDYSLAFEELRAALAEMGQ